jgi:nitroreductase
MSIIDIIKRRRSIRKYKTNLIPQEIIDELIEALIWAPSAGNLQSRKFYFIFDEALKTKIAEAAYNQDFISKAPLVIVGCVDENKIKRYGERGKNLYGICDVSASIQNLMLVATEKGLGTCWVGGFDENKVKEILNLPTHLRPIVIVPVGYPAENPKPPKRVSKDEAVEII